METDFSAAFFKGNREKLKAQLPGNALVVLTANGLLQRSGDRAFPFQQDSSFWYLSGLDEPDIVLVMSHATTFLIVPVVDDVHKVFEGAVEPEQLKNQSGISTVLYGKKGWDKLKGLVNKHKVVATLMPSASYIKQYHLYTNPARTRLIKRLRASSRSVRFKDIRPELAHMRMVKQPQELAAIQKSIAITVKTLQLVKNKLGQYKTEAEIEADISNNYAKHTASHGFDPMVASGRHTQNAHYMKNSDILPKQGMLIIDTGAAYQRYQADITRTYAIGQPSKRQQQLHEAVLAVRAFALEQLKPGVVLRQYEQAVESYMGDVLLTLKLIKTKKSQEIRLRYPHLTSHSLGLDTHDAADYDRPLQPNTVITVEPGIYISEEGLGVRVEDDVLITGDGNQVLSRQLPVAL